MMMCRNPGATLVLCFSALGAMVGHVEGNVVMSLSTLVTGANDGTGSSRQSDNALMPWYTQRTVDKGASSATTTYDFRMDGDDVVFDLAFDICLDTPTIWPLDEGESCTDWGYSEFDICSPNGICLLDLVGGTEVICYDLCMTSEGAFDSQPHTDCRDTADTCVDRFGLTDMGLCE